MTEQVSLTRYEAARAALAEAVNVDEVQALRTDALKLKAYAKIAKDKHLQADAAAIVIRAERKLGVLIQSAKETGQLGIGRRAKSNVLSQAPDDEADSAENNGSDTEPFTRTTLAEAGIDKKLSMRAQNWARLGEGEFEQKLKDVREKIEKSGAAIVDAQRDLTTADKKAKRGQREAELGAKQQALPDKIYGVIYADPEWQFGPWGRETGLDRLADNHYPTSPLADIKARPVATIAAKDCVLFLWATVPMLPDALEVMAAWGFAYKSHVIWRKAETMTAKLVLGTGFWFRNGHELLLVGTRGNVPAPAMGEQLASVIDAPPRKHSEKPAWAYDLIEKYFPSLPKIELNARARRDGWDAWGYEAPDEESQSESNDGLTREAQPQMGGEADGVASRLSVGGGSDATTSDPGVPTEKGFPRPDGGAPDTGSSDTDNPGGAAAPTLAADLVAAADGGEGVGQEPLPAGKFRSSPETDAIIRAGYTTEPFDLKAITALVCVCAGAIVTARQVKDRASKLGLSSRERQRAAVAESNKRRAQHGRPAPRINPREIVARLVFNPNGGHQLEVAVPSNVVSMIFEEHQIPQLERAIAQWRERVHFEEGRGRAFQTSIPLEVE